MGRTLLLCDNEFLKGLYTMNLEVYLATKVTLCTSAVEAILLHRKHKNEIDLIITLSVISKRDAAKELVEYRSAYGVKTPMIIIGGDKEVELDPRTFILNTRYHLPTILKKAAGLLGITAKKMAELELDEFYPISIEVAENIQRAPCALYINLNSKKFDLIVRSDEEVGDKISVARGKGVSQIFVRSTERLTLINSVSVKLIEKFTKALNECDWVPVEKKVEVLNEGFEFASANLFSSEEIKTEMQEIANASSKVMADVVREKSHLKALLDTMLSNKSGYIFIHSMIISYVASHILKNVSWGGKGQSEKINFVLFFHDIYLAPIYLKHPQLKYEKNLLSCPDLSQKEREIVMEHAKLAAELVVVYKKCPMGADLLIKHHHGMAKGIGFAVKYPEDLSPITKVILIAEMFTEEFMALSEKNKKADPQLIIPKLINEFVLASYIKIIQTLVNIPL